MIKHLMMIILIAILWFVALAIRTVPTATIMIEKEQPWKEAYKSCEIERNLALVRGDIYKRQIKNLQAENDGLRTIINKDKKLKSLIDK